MKWPPIGDIFGDEVEKSVVATDMVVVVIVLLTGWNLLVAGVVGVGGLILGVNPGLGL